jgi:hypothetical protein
MAGGSDGRRWIVRGLLVGLMASGGCHSTQVGPGDPMKLEPMHDITATDPNEGLQGRMHNWFARQKIKQFDTVQDQ